MLSADAFYIILSSGTVLSSYVMCHMCM